MNIKKRDVIIVSLFFFTIPFLPSNALACRKATEVDVLVYGGTSSGVIAAYTAKQMGKSVILVEPGQNIGGMSAGGLGFTDIGNKYVVTGLALDFYRRLGTHYGKLEHWIFEPSVAEAIFNDYMTRANVDVWRGKRLHSLKKKGTVIQEITVEDSKNPAKKTNQRIKAKVFIDCSHEGDLMAKANVSYEVGREANEKYNETYNGVQLLDQHQFPDSVDPYVEKGNPASGLLWGVNPEPVKPNGTGDNKVQAYNFRVCLTYDPENRIEITKPDNYDPSRYELLLRLKEKDPWKSFSDVFIWVMMPNKKTDINNKGGFSTDMIGMNWNYPEASYEEREKIFKAHEDYTKGMFYFIGHDERIPENIRNQMRQWGYPKDEYTNTGNWSPWLYVRESRRMVGELVMTQHHCQGREVVPDPIGWAAYTMDSHNCDRHVVNGMVKNEGNVEIGGFPPYPISYRSIIPKRKEATNLYVPFCMSASHIAYGSIRMEPVFMVLGQAAGVAASLAIDNHKNIVHDVDVSQVQQLIKNNPLVDGTLPEIVVDNENKENVSLKGEWLVEGGKAYGRNFLFDNSKGATFKSVTYTPDIVTPGKYNVYVYYPKLADIASQNHITVSNGTTTSEVVIRAANVVIEGQTSGEWIHIGEYEFKKGRMGYVEINNKGADGRIIADAVLFIPQKDK